MGESVGMAGAGRLRIELLQHLDRYDYILRPQQLKRDGLLPLFAWFWSDGLDQDVRVEQAMSLRG